MVARAQASNNPDGPSLLPANTRLAEVSIRHAGVFCRQQAIDAGFTTNQIVHRLRNGVWETLLPSVYKLRGDPLDWMAQVHAALLWAGSESVISHSAAARIWVMPGFDDPSVEVTVSGGGRKSQLVRVHRNALEKNEIVVRGPLRLTSVARTLLDIGGFASPNKIEAAVDHALLRRMVTLERLVSQLDRYGVNGRPGCAALRKVVAGRDPKHRPKMSDLEREFFRLLTRRKVRLPVAQHPVVLPDGCDVRIDFAYPDRMLAIETDGYVWHGGKLQWQKDAIRSNELVRLGWRVVRITWDDVMKRPDQVISLIKELIGC